MDIGTFAASFALAGLAYAAIGFVLRTQRQDQRGRNREDRWAPPSVQQPVVASVFYDEFRNWAKTHPAQLAEEYVALVKGNGHDLGPSPQEFVSGIQSRILSDRAFHASVIEEMLEALREVERANPQHFENVMQMFMQRAVAGQKLNARPINA